MECIHIAMVTPTSESIYAPSRFSPGPVVVSAAVANSSPVRGLVSFEPDGRSNPVEMDFYGSGWDAWYVRLDDAIAAGYVTGYIVDLPIVYAISADAGFVETVKREQ